MDGWMDDGTKLSQARLVSEPLLRFSYLDLGLLFLSRYHFSTRLSDSQCVDMGQGFKRTVLQRTLARIFYFPHTQAEIAYPANLIYVLL